MTIKHVRITCFFLITISLLLSREYLITIYNLTKYTYLPILLFSSMVFLFLSYLKLDKITFVTIFTLIFSGIFFVMQIAFNDINKIESIKTANEYNCIVLKNLINNFSEKSNLEKIYLLRLDTEIYKNNLSVAVKNNIKEAANLVALSNKLDSLNSRLDTAFEIDNQVSSGAVTDNQLTLELNKDILNRSNLIFDQYCLEISTNIKSSP